MQDGGYAFRHALFQDAAYQSLLLSRRREHHSAIARTLEQSFPDVADNQPDLVAQHYTAAEAPEQAIPYWLRAGERAMARQAFHEPAAHFERGLELARTLPEGQARSRHVLDLLLALGDARARVGPYEECFDAYNEAAELARGVGSPADLVRVALGFEDAELLMGRGGTDRESLPRLELALAALGAEESVERCRVLSRLGRALFEIGLTERAGPLLRDATNIARRLGDRHALFDALLCEHITTTGYPWSAREFPKRCEALNEIVAIAEECGDPGLVTRAEGRRMPALLEMADLAGFEASLAHWHAIMEQHRVVGELWGLASADAMQAILQGDFRNAERLAEKALELAPGMRTDIATGVYGVQMFTIRREQGRLAEVAPVLRRFIDENPRDTAWRPGLALIASDLGFDQAARNTFEDLAAAGFAFPIDAKWSVTISYLAEVCARLGDVPRAAELYDLLSPYRDLTIIAPVATVCCGSAAHYLGLLASVIGDWTRAKEHFEGALAMNEQLQAWPWLAHTQQEFAAALLTRAGHGDPIRAAHLLAAATETAQRLGMTSLLQRIRSLAH
jgi:tetratricopeptide (TPR) repeat protein